MLYTQHIQQRKDNFNLFSNNKKIMYIKIKLFLNCAWWKNNRL